MPYAFVTVSASSGAVTSKPIALDWRGGKPVLWRLTTSSSLATGDYTIQYSLDDIMLSAYSTTYPPTGVVTGLPSSIGIWSGISSYPYTGVIGSSTAGAPALHFTSSNIFPDGISGVFSPPPAALRLSSTNSSSNVTTLTILQGEGG
jgi:hypothetical protein